jgi:leucyl/phenylalanyl-tRNA---protein transferase
MARLTPELIVAAYAEGVFPMASGARSRQIEWFSPQWRGILPLEGFHASRSLLRRRRRGLDTPGGRVPFVFTCDRDFAGVVAGCANRAETWINADIARVFAELHALGLAHSVEVWADKRLVGGVYGLALGGAFFAESMFSAVTDGSKLALAELVARLCAGGYVLLDTQYLTPHLASLGGIEIARADYLGRLERALAVGADPLRAFGP